MCWCSVLFSSFGPSTFQKIKPRVILGFFRADEIRAALFEEYDSFLKLRSVQERYTTSEYVPSGTRRCPCRRLRVELPVARSATANVRHRGLLQLGPQHEKQTPEPL